MGLLDKLVAAANVAASSAADALEKKAGAVDEDLAEEGWYRGLKTLGAGAEVVARGALGAAEGVGGAALEQLGRTELGQTIGDTARGISDLFASLPVFSAIADTRRAMHGIDALYAHLRQDPRDPARYLWLVEAIDDLERDRGRARALKAVVDPLDVLRALSLQLPAKVAAGVDTRERLLRNAFALSVERALADPADAEGLHGLGRVYLLTGRAGDAVSFCRMALAAGGPAAPAAPVTLARADQGPGESARPPLAARRALAGGQTWGNRVLAELALGDEALEPADRIQSYSDLCDAVAPADEVAYRGPRPRGLGVLGELGSAQLTKAAAAIYGGAPTEEGA